MKAPPSKTLLTIIALSIAAATAGCATRDADGTSPSSASNTSVAAPSSPSSRRSKYADGTYTAIGQYGGLPSSIGVSVTLVDDVISAVTVTPHATDPTSLDYQTRFAQAVPALVVGRNIDEVNCPKWPVPAVRPTGSTPPSNRSRPKPPTDVHLATQPHIRTGGVQCEQP
jgi:uncharacterized protein with FMN-binding domain